jgi:hypothetical protein
MIISSSILILASYVGPHASPNANLYETPRARQRIERNHTDYARPGINRNAYANPNNPPPPKPKEIPPGRMVVPEKFL